MANDTRGYRAYLVRFWDAGSPGAPLWRVSVQDVQTGERRGFPDLASLVAFLSEQIAPASREDERQQPDATDVG